MSKSRWSDFVEPDLSHASASDVIDKINGRRRERSVIPDPLTVLIAAESGRPILIPIFPINAFTPARQCDHAARPIPKGSPLVCMDCHDTGLRNHKAIRLYPGDLPGPEPTDDPPEPTKCEYRADHPDALTRKQRRALKHAQRGASEDARPVAEPGHAAGR
jgi:hypothetical protein